MIPLLPGKGALITLYWVNPSKRGGMDGVFWGLAGLLQGISRGRSPREIPRSSPASPMKTPYMLTLLLGFTFYLKYDILVLSDFSSSNIDVWRSILVAKFLEYVFCIIRIFLVLLWHCYVPEIQFSLIIFSLVKKTLTFIIIIVSCNWIDHMLV